MALTSTPRMDHSTQKTNAQKQGNTSRNTMQYTQTTAINASALRKHK